MTHDSDEREFAAPLTEDEYWALVEEAANELLDEFEDEVREYARTGETPDGITEELQTARENIVQFTLDHPDSMLGLRFGVEYVYLGSILQHSNNSGSTGYFEYVREYGDQHPNGPTSAGEALALGALYAMTEDVLDRWKELRDSVIQDEKAKQAAE